MSSETYTSFRDFSEAQVRKAIEDTIQEIKDFKGDWELGDGRFAKEWMDKPMEDCQNNSPTMGELLGEFDGDNVDFIGYIVHPPRGDARVTVEGVEVHGLSELSAYKLAHAYHWADEVMVSEEGNGRFTVRLWWD